MHRNYLCPMLCGQKFASCCLLIACNISLGRAFETHGQDPFVQVAPLVVGMACSDGIAIVATHSGLEEPLLFYDATKLCTEKEEGAKSSDVAQDLPSTFAGPLRIKFVGNSGAALVPCGWRADGDVVAELAREILENERLSFGNDAQSNVILPSLLARALAEHSTHESIRALSCACLVASPGESVDTSKGSLYLVDETGAYRVRAHCLGGGIQTTDDVNDSNDSGNAKFVADVVNRRLLEMFNEQRLRLQGSALDLDHFDMTAEEGLEALVRLLAGKSNANPSAVKNNGAIIGAEDRLELVIVFADGRRHRKKTDRSWGISASV